MRTVRRSAQREYLGCSRCDELERRARMAASLLTLLDDANRYELQLVGTNATLGSRVARNVKNNTQTINSRVTNTQKRNGNVDPPGVTGCHPRTTHHG
jgi:hypothetical protein